MKQTISFTQEVEVLSQELVNTAIIAAIKVNNKSGNIDCACNCLTEAMHSNSESLGDRVYGNITEFLINNHWTSKKLDYWVDVKKDPEEATLTLMRNTYKYSK